MAYIKVGYNKIPAYNYTELVHKGIKKPLPGYTFMRMFDINKLHGNTTSLDLVNDPETDLKEDYELIKKFWKRYPELRYLPVTGPLKHQYGGAISMTHPASHFVQKVHQYKKQGYNDYKAFEMVGKELEAVIQKQAEEQRILRGVAIDNGAYSYLDRVQQIAELESRLKMQRLERDMPKFLRAQRAYIESFEQLQRQQDEDSARSHNMTTSEFLGQIGEKAMDKNEEYEYTPERVEDMMRKQFDFYKEAKYEKYEPVLYQIIKDPRELADRESLTQTHDRFLDKTQKILQIHHQRSHIHDGLRHLNDNDIVQKVREAPTQLKRKAKSFLKKLRKFGAKLNDEGELDLTDVQEDNVRKYFEKNASLVRLTLMQADLEFEYPQKLEKMKIQADVYQLAVKEDEKLKFADYAKDAAEARKRVLTYEEYFQLDATKDGQPKPKIKKGFVHGQSSKGDTTFDEFRAQRESNNMF